MVIKERWLICFNYSWYQERGWIKFLKCKQWSIWESFQFGFCCTCILGLKKILMGVVCLLSSDGAALEYDTMSFSASEFLATITGVPDHKLILWYALNIYTL